MKVDDIIKSLEYCKQNVGNVEVKIWNYDDNSISKATTVVDYEENCLYIGARKE